MKYRFDRDLVRRDFVAPAPSARGAPRPRRRRGTLLNVVEWNIQIQGDEAHARLVMDMLSRAARAPMSS